MQPLGIMTWNVRYFGHGWGGLRATEGWIRRMARRLAALDPLPDVLALQEVEARSLRGGLHQDPQLNRFMDEFHAALVQRGKTPRFRGLYWPAHRYALRVGHPLYTTGLALIVSDRMEVAGDPTVRDITHVRLSVFEPMKQRRIAAHVRLRLRASRDRDWIDLFNTHLSLPAFLEVGPHRVPDRMGHGSNQLAEVEKLLSFVDRHAGSKAVILGDFNTLPGSPVYQRVRHLGWVDAFAETRGLELSEQLRWGTARFLHKHMHIDHVFSTPGLRWSAFGDHRIDAGPLVGLSDHAPKLGWVDG